MDDPARKATGQLGSYAYSSRNELAGQTERTAGDVLRDIVGNVQEIIRSEVQLAKAETREEIGKASSASLTTVIGAVCGLYAVGFVLLGIVWALALVVSAWLSALIVGVVLGVAAAVMVSRGLTEWHRVNPKPERTIETVKENVEWMKNQTK